MFRNSEGYANPTAGAALARLTYAERQRAREACEMIEAAVRKERGDAVKPDRSRWVKAWTREQVRPCKQTRNGGKAK